MKELTTTQALLLVLLYTRCPMSDLADVVNEAKLMLEKGPEGLDPRLVALAAGLEEQLQPVLRCEERLCSTPDQDVMRVKINNVTDDIRFKGVKEKTWCFHCRARNAHVLDLEAEACR